MSTETIEGPASAPDPDDPGDEVQRRFRYQVNYTCLKAILLLATSSGIVALYCEHVEDILIEAHDGKFIGVQIKTREIGQPHFKSNDDQVLGALARFCARDKKFPGWFSSFVFATNYVFHGGDGLDNLRNVLDVCRDGSFAQLGVRSKIRKYVEQLATKTGLAVEQVVSTLARVTLEERKTGIDQPDLEIVHALGSLDAFKGLPFDKLMLGVERLRSLVWNASSKGAEGLVLESQQPTDEFNTLMQNLHLAQKKIVSGDVAQLLANLAASDSSAELLTIAGYLSTDAPFPGLQRMEIKMAAGAISYDRVAQMKDNVASLETTFVRWKERYGLEEANRRLAHVQHLALRDARTEYSAHEGSDAPYGSAMLGKLEERAKETCSAESGSMFGCRKEHVLGAAGLLCDQCKVWWSEKIEVVVGE